mmetsp:Transcript_33484/g.66152  ORF Transcript_33484/g.66152 Transcript_33484/m.66152 type:complete len:413 (-) Transcript_33484:74-1312(-)
MPHFPSLESFENYDRNRDLEFSEGKTETFESTTDGDSANVEQGISYDTGCFTNTTGETGDTGQTENTSRYSIWTEQAQKACCAKSVRFCCCHVPLGYIPIILMLILISLVLAMIPAWYYGVCPVVIWSDELFSHMFESQAIAATNQAMRKADDDMFETGNGVILIGDSYVKQWENGENCGYDREFCSETTLPGSLNMGVEKSTCAALSYFTNDQVGSTDGSPRVQSGYEKFLGNQTLGVRWAVISCGEQDIQFSQCGLFSFTGHTPEFAFNAFKSTATGILGSDAGKRSSSYTTILFVSTVRDPSSRMHHADFSKYDDLVRNYARALASEKRKESAKSDTAFPHSTPPIVYVDAARSFEKIGNKEEFFSPLNNGLSPLGYSYWSDWVYNALAEAGSGNNCITWVGQMCTLRL